MIIALLVCLCRYVDRWPDALWCAVVISGFGYGRPLCFVDGLMIELLL